MKRMNYLFFLSLALVFSIFKGYALPSHELSSAGRTVTDQAGRTVAISGSVERIISGYYISSSALIALGLEDKLVGIEARANERPIYALAAPALLNLPSVGTARELNMEAALALHPDLVILPIRQRASADIMEELGIPVLLVDPESPEDLMAMIELIGRAANAEYRASLLLNHYSRSLDEIRRITSGITDRPLVYMGGVGSYLSTAPAEMYQSSLIELAGGINAAGDIPGSARTAISYEHLLAMNPEVIVIPSEAAYTREDILGDPQLANITAVLSGRVYHMPGNIEAWDSPVTSFTLGIRWLLSVLHGDVYSMELMREYAAAFYAEFYGIEIDEQIIK